MGSKKNCQVSEFRQEGRFVGFELEDGYKIKRIRLATAEGEYSIKLSKEARIFLGQVLIPGSWVEVSGERKLDRESGEQKLKAYRVSPKAVSQTQIAPPANAKPPATKQACILVCQKSDCCKRGAMEVTHALAEGLRDRGLEGEVKIKGTGCMKQCKMGPNIVMPDKTTYRRVDAEEIPELLDKHFKEKETQPLEPVPELATVV